MQYNVFSFDIQHIEIIFEQKITTQTRFRTSTDMAH